jgi:signal transduction histidine kinase
VIPFSSITTRRLVLVLVALAAQTAILAAVNPPPWSGEETAAMLLCVAFATAIPFLLARHLSSQAQELARPATEPARQTYLALALGISHELRQPLFAIQLMTRNLLLQASDNEEAAFKASISRIATQTDKAITIINRTLDLSRQLPQPCERVELVSAIGECLADWRTTCSDQTIETTVTITDCPGANAHAAVDPLGFEQVIANALENAAQSIARRKQAGWNGRGRIEIELTCRPRWIGCLIRDNGAGIDSRVLHRAFEPFYSTKAEETGGLGLFLSREIISQSGGTIELLPCPDGGAMLAINLPRA